MLTQERLKTLLIYDPQTGIFRWRAARPGIVAGSEAGTITSRGYIRICLDGVIYRAHRLAWLYMTGEWPSDQIDHIDLDKANNRISNLREATRAQNSANRGAQKNNKSGFKGVHYSAQRNCYFAQIATGGQKTFLGTYERAEDAAAAYRAAAIIQHSKFWRD